MPRTLPSKATSLSCWPCFTQAEIQRSGSGAEANFALNRDAAIAEPNDISEIVSINIRK
ncbi:MAG TPA: hypothetical protein VJ805_04300 [Nitrospiraceae bacterium]|nr:hypothetical protein [Nitrospiraceae bacterium]